MARVDWQEQFREIMKAYADKAYTEKEVVHAVVLLFEGGDVNCNELFWSRLPDWIKEKIFNILEGLNMNSRVYAPAISDGNEAMKRRYLSLKSWLESKNIVQGEGTGADSTSRNRPVI